MTISTVGICGSGTMGRGIAIASLLAGKGVVLYDISEAACSGAKQSIADHLVKMVEKGRITEADRIRAEAALSTATSLSALSASDIVIEAIVERIEVKHELFTALEDVVSEQAIIATNTSSISIAALARPLTQRARFVGLHFFNPAHIMKLVEVIRGPLTSDDVVSTCIAFAKSLGKAPVVAKDTPGFIVNRVARNYYNEAQRIVMEGASSMEQVDSLMKGLGFKMGPFELMDLIGIDTNLDVTKSQWHQYFLEPRFQPSLLQQQYVDAGLHGDKTNGGFRK